MAEQLPEWQSGARKFADRLGLRQMVPVLASVRVATPTLVGWVKPAVVLPLAVLARMPPAQIDLVLAHELAHLKRLDHIANLFQVVLETLLLYHPVVHWISRDARNERELCCDTLALRVTGGERRDFVAAWPISRNSGQGTSRWRWPPVEASWRSVPGSSSALSRSVRSDTRGATPC